ncbi:MAG: SatD family protein [Acidimicrobiia bacterium]
MEQPTTRVAALIGDLVASRQATDRPGLQRGMESVFETVDGLVGGNPVFTIGDEFQARFPTITQALEATLQLHLRASHLTRLRIGIGWGELVAEDPERSPYGQDGPCWWRAREAIEALDQAPRGRPVKVRTVIRTDSSFDAILNGYLLLRDTVLDGFDQVDTEIAIGLLDGLNQTELASRLAINKSSVSRRAHAHGILALMDASDLRPFTIPARS